MFVTSAHLLRSVNKSAASSTACRRTGNYPASCDGLCGRRAGRCATAKRTSLPLLSELGLAYHGFAIRRPRRGPRPSPTTANETYTNTDFQSLPKSQEDNLNVP